MTKTARYIAGFIAAAAAIVTVFATVYERESPAKLDEIVLEASSLTPTTIVRALDGAEQDSLALHMPGFEVLDNEIVFSESRRSHVSILAPDLRLRGRFGQAGEGPGDLGLPISLRRAPAGYAVMEAGNRRVSFWSVEGAYQGSTPVPGPSETFGVDAANRVYTASIERGYYATVSDSSGRSRGLGRRKFRGAFEVSGGNGGLDMVAVTTDGSVHVFDNMNRVLLRYDSTGNLTLARRLPRLVADAVAAFVSKTDEGFRGVGVGGSTAALKEFRATTDGRLFIRYDAENDFALLIEPVTYTALQLTYPSDSLVRDRLKSAFTMTVRDSLLYAVSMDGRIDVIAIPQALRGQVSVRK